MIILKQFFFLACLFLMVLAFSKASHAQDDAEAYRVKSIVGGQFDSESAKNLQSLLRLAESKGKVQVWVATEAPFDSSLQIGTIEFDAQFEKQMDYHFRLLDALGMSPANADFPKSGPYFAIDANGRDMVRLLYTRGVKGFWGIAGGRLLSSAN